MLCCGAMEYERRCPFPECRRITTYVQVNEKVFLPGRAQRAAPAGTSFRCSRCGHHLDRIEFERLPKHNNSSRFNTTGIGGEGHCLVGNTIRHTASHNKVREPQRALQGLTEITGGGGTGHVGRPPKERPGKRRAQVCVGAACGTRCTGAWGLGRA